MINNDKMFKNAKHLSHYLQVVTLPEARPSPIFPMPMIHDDDSWEEQNDRHVVYKHEDAREEAKRLNTKERRQCVAQESSHCCERCVQSSTGCTPVSIYSQ